MSGRSQTPGARTMRRYRAANPGYVERNNLRGTARKEALEALARKHPAEFAALYQAELEHAGLDGTVEMERPCRCGGVIRRRAPAGRWPSACDSCRAANAGIADWQRRLTRAGECA